MGAWLTRRFRSARENGLWTALALPGIAWLVLFFLAPEPVWDPIKWSGSQFTYVIDRIVGSDGIFGPALLRTAVYVLLASAICMCIAFPVAYFVARLAGRRRGVILALLIAPFWISYMMRMLAWVN